MKAKKMSRKKSIQRQKKEKLNSDNEVTIGLNAKKNKSKEVNKSKLAKKKTSRKRAKILVWTTFIVAILIAIVLLMFSDLFNITQIKVINNNKISSLEIINLSTLKTEENMFKTKKSKIIESIKTNPYIEKVEILRKIDGTVIIDITERSATYIIELNNGYAYINNQGYILEISAIKLDVPNITGISTDIENIKPGNRLEVEDLKKLDSVIQIMQSLESKHLSKLITDIDITNSSNYILVLENEKKTIHFGDSSQINEKVLWIEYEVNENKDIEGTLFLNNMDKPYFRDKV